MKLILSFLQQIPTADWRRLDLALAMDRPFNLLNFIRLEVESYSWVEQLPDYRHFLNTFHGLWFRTASVAGGR
jgi:hypothetical protein